MQTMHAIEYAYTLRINMCSSPYIICNNNNNNCSITHIFCYLHAEYLKRSSGVNFIILLLLFFYIALHMYVYLLAVPPNIDDNASSSDVTVGEGANVTMNCRATGSPEPSVRWKRDDNSKIKLKNETYGKCSL